MAPFSASPLPVLPTALFILAACSLTVVTHAFAPLSLSRTGRHSSVSLSLSSSSFGLFVGTRHPSSCSCFCSCSSVIGLTSPAVSSRIIVRAAKEEDNEEASSSSSSDDDEEKAEPKAEAAQEEEEVEEKKKVVEDPPEVKELKEKIASLEAKLKSKKLDVSRIKDLAEDYSKAGYARKVAEMENIRRIRGMAFTSNRFTAKANIVQSFLPILDELTKLDETYADDDDFAKKYSALRWDFNNALKELDVEEYNPQVGVTMDPTRVVAVEEEYSNEYEKGVVIKPLKMGMEIKGNVMRMAEAVVSLGSEADAKKAEEEAAAAAAAAAAKAEEEAAAAEEGSETDGEE